MRIRIISICGLGFISILLSGCHKTVSPPLSNIEKSDILDGVAFAEKRLPVDRLEANYSNFTRSKEMATRSRYFKAGADYRALLLADQVRQSAAIDEMFNESEVVRTADRERKERATVLCSTAWNAFHQDLLALSLTPDEFGKVVANDDLAPLMSYDRYGFED